MPLVYTNGTYGIIESNIPTSHLVTVAMGFAIIVSEICTVLAPMLLEIGVNGVELGIYVLGCISEDSRKLFV